MATESEVRNALRGVQEPELKKNIVELGTVRDLPGEGNGVAFTPVLPSPAHPYTNRIPEAARSAVRSLDGAAGEPDSVRHVIAVIRGAPVVTSPRNLAGMVVGKAAGMMRQVEVPILGLIENRGCCLCPGTGNRHRIFGPGDPEAMARERHTPFPGSLPLDPEIASLGDRGEIESYPGERFESISKRIAAPAPTEQEPKMPLRASRS